MPEQDPDILHSLVAEGKADAIQAAVHAGAAVDARDSSGMTPLMVAIEGDDAACVRSLLAAGADPTLTWPNPRQSAWCLAMCQAGAVALGEALLAAVDDPRELTRSAAPEGEETAYLWTCLFALYRKGGRRLAQALLDQGLDPNERLANGMTPLLIAAQKVDAKTAEIVPVLLAAGADPEAVTEPNHAMLRRREEELQRKEALGLDVSILRRKASVHKPQGVLDLAKKNGKWALTLLRKELPASQAELDRYDQADAAVAGLKAAAREEAFQTLADEIRQAVGAEPKAVRGKPGLFRYAIKLKDVAPLEADTADDELRRLDPLQQKARAAGATLLYENDADDGLASRVKLLLLPTRDWAVALCLSQTNGDGYGLSTRDLVNALERLRRRFPFELEGCGKDFAALRFEPSDDPLALYNELVSLCPDFGDSQDRLPREFESALAEETCFLWWD